MVYAGSMERLDFSEEGAEKGFCLVEIKSESVATKRQVSFDFHAVKGRRFLTINVNIEPQDTDPTATVLKAVAEHEVEVRDAIVRLQVDLPAELESRFSDSSIRNTLKEAHSFNITKDIKRATRLRLGQWTAEEITPADALKAYLESKTPPVPPERVKTLLEYGERLIREQQTKQS